MKYLLIDFGATYIKCAVYEDGIITPTISYDSPFQTGTSIKRANLLKLLTNTVSNHKGTDAIVICTILGGKWENEVYKSWKCLKGDDVRGSNCMVGGLFDSNVVHIDHQDFIVAAKYTDKLVVIGSINNIPLYSPLGDTDCVIRSLSIPDNGVAINMGTGSQVISRTSKKRFFPAGRSFLTFNKLFECSTVSIFDVMQKLTVEDVRNSTLEISLAVFEQSRNWNGGGGISRITESDFSIKNMVSSILKAFVNQYREAIGEADHITLVGGIARKLHILPQLFELYYPGKTIVLEDTKIEATHKGLVAAIKEDLE